jgi:hypothetical protein
MFARSVDHLGAGGDCGVRSDRGDFPVVENDGAGRNVRAADRMNGRPLIAIGFACGGAGSVSDALIFAAR